MAPISENPFAALTTVVAPAILTNASSVLCLGTANRLARVVDRTRVVSAELARVVPNAKSCGLPTPTGGSQSAMDPCSQGAEVVLPVSWIVCCGHSDLAFWGGSCKFWPAHPFPFHRSPGPCFRHTWRRRVGFRLLHNGAGDTAEPSESRRRCEANGS